MSVVEVRALKALYRNHPATPPNMRYSSATKRLAFANRDMLLAWAATQPDETLLDCRNLGTASLAWIREQTGDPKSPFADLEDENAVLRSRIEELEAAAKRMPVAIINLGPDATPADEANLRVQFGLAVAAERARIRAAVEGLNRYHLGTWDPSSCDIALCGGGGIDRAAVLAIIDNGG